MSGMSGLELLAQVKGEPILRRIPVIMLASSDLGDDIARAYELGASGHIRTRSNAASSALPAREILVQA